MIPKVALTESQKPISYTEAGSNKSIRHADAKSEVIESFSSPAISDTKIAQSITQALIIEAESPVNIEKAMQDTIRKIQLLLMYLKKIIQNH